MKVTDYLKDATAKVSLETFRPAADADDKRAFDVTLQLILKPELQKMLKACTRPVRKLGPNGGREMVEEVMPDLLRARLAEHVLGWERLTYGLLADLANLETPNGAKTDWAEKSVEFSQENVVATMEAILGFEDWALSRLTSLADARERQEARSKNVSAPTPAGSPST